MNASQTTTVDVYVRLCGEGRDDCREISFRIPEGLAQSELLEGGFAIDGNQAIYSVMAGATDDRNVPYVPLADALLDAQRYIVKMLSEHGFEVNFK